MEKAIDFDRIIDYWKESADKDFKTMLDLYETKNYSWALFMGHLVKTGHAPSLLKQQYLSNKRENIHL